MFWVSNVRAPAESAVERENAQSIECKPLTTLSAREFSARVMKRVALGEDCGGGAPWEMIAAG